MKKTPIEVKNLEIELDATYDYDNFDFEDNIERYNKSNLFQYIDHGNIAVLSTRDLIFIKKSNKKADLEEAVEYFGGWAYDHETKEDLIEKIYDMNIEDLVSHSWSNNKSIWDILDVTLKFELITTRGYSQGDVMDIVVPHIIREVWGSKKSWFIEQCQTNGNIYNNISHFCWDSRIVGDITVKFDYNHNCVPHTFEIEEGEDYDNLQDYLDDHYEMKINAGCVLGTIRHKLEEKGFELSESSVKEITERLEFFDHTDVKHPNSCHC